MGRVATRGTPTITHLLPPTTQRSSADKRVYPIKLHPHQRSGAVRDSRGSGLAVRPSPPSPVPTAARIGSDHVPSSWSPRTVRPLLRRRRTRRHAQQMKHRPSRRWEDTARVRRPATYGVKTDNTPPAGGGCSQTPPGTPGERSREGSCPIKTPLSHPSRLHPSPTPVHPPTPVRAGSSHVHSGAQPASPHKSPPPHPHSTTCPGSSSSRRRPRASGSRFEGVARCGKRPDGEQYDIPPPHPA